MTYIDILKDAGIPFERWGGETTSSEQLSVEFQNEAAFTRAVDTILDEYIPQFDSFTVPINIMRSLLDAIEGDYGWDFMQNADNAAMVNEFQRMMTDIYAEIDERRT